MGEVRPLPALGGVFSDARGHGRTLRVSWHTDEGLVVLSLWDAGRCTGSVRLGPGDVPELIHALALGLAAPAAAVAAGPVAATIARAAATPATGSAG